MSNMENSEDLDKLRDIDPRPYAEKSKQIYRNYFSSKGASELFIKICQ